MNGEIMYAALKESDDLVSDISRDVRVEKNNTEVTIYYVDPPLRTRLSGCGEYVQPVVCKYCTAKVCAQCYPFGECWQHETVTTIPGMNISMRGRSTLEINKLAIEYSTEGYSVKIVPYKK